jgi:glycerol-3-phosphate acyltransferase PlsY
MIVNDTVTGIIAIIIGYLLGSISSAYIVTRLKTGKDIRKLGGGNAGARNVYHEVGLWQAIIVGVFDAGKGVLAVYIALLLLGAPAKELTKADPTFQMFILATGLAAVAGHMWPIYFGFKGGNGLATSLGVLAFVMTQELLIALAFVILFVVITRNPIFSINLSLLTVPISAWLMEKPWLFVVFSIVLLLILILNFIPTARAAIAKAGSRGYLFAELLRRDNTGKKKKKKVS